MWNDGTTGKRNASLGFDGTNDYVTAGSPTTFDISDGTASFWAQPQELGSGTKQKLLAKDNSGNNSGDWNIHINIGGSADLITFRIEDGLGGSFEVDSNSAPSLNTWVHVTVTWGSGGMRMYIDGILQTDTDAHTGGMTNTSANLLFGMLRAPSEEPFEGLIDEVKVYNYVLTQQQIRDDYNQGTVRFGPDTGSP